jgi:hypothetical protein
MIWKIFVAILGSFILSIVALVAKDVEIPTTDRDRTVVTVTPTAAPTTVQNAFTEMKFVKVGNHTYYPETMFALKVSKEEHMEMVISQMKNADRFLDVDVYVTGFNSMFDTEDFRMFGRRMTNGVVEEEMNLNSGWDKATDTVRWYSRPYGLTEYMPQVTIDTDGIMPASLLFEKVYTLAKEHEKSIFAHRRVEPIRGTYMLMADEAGVIYYEFTINRYSTIGVNAKTGEVIKQYYWDGVYVD